MRNIAKMLKEAIERTAKKQVREETRALRKASVQQRKIIAGLSARVKDLERETAQIQKRLPKPTMDVGEFEAGKFRFSSKSLKSLRKRLRLSAKECGSLIGVSSGTIGNWERSTPQPKGEQIAALAALRKMGKREVRKHLEELDQQ